MGVLSVPINEEIMACPTWQAVLAHALTRREVMDEVNCVTSLHRAAKLYRDDDNGRTPLAAIQNEAGLKRLLELVWHFACRCRPQQLANAVWACAVLLLRDSRLLEKLCDFSEKRLPFYVPQNVANTVWALATLSFNHERLLTLVPTYIEQNVKDFSPQDLANTCWAFAKLQRQCDEVFQQVVRESLAKLPTFQAQNMSNLVWACATLLYKDESSMLKIADFAASRADTFSTQELSNLTWGMATLNYMSHAWMEAGGAEMKRRQTECCPQDLSNTIWAYGTLVYKQNEVLRAINWEVMRQLEWFSPQGLANVTWGLSAIEYRDIKALTAISEEVIRRPMEQLTPPDISTLLYSFAVLAWTHPGALQKLRRCVRYLLPVFATRDVANVSWAMVTLSHRDDDMFVRLMACAVPKIADFTITGLCNIAWAFVRFGVAVPKPIAVGIAEETLKRREELREEPGDAILLSDAVCSEWSADVPAELLEVCDAVGREQYDRVFEVLGDFSNIPSLDASPHEVECYQRRVEGLNVIQLGRRLTVEIMRRFGMAEESPEAAAELRPPRERWLRDEISRADPTDATLQHKTTGTWMLSLGGDTSPLEVVASGSPMDAPVRFASCVVEHPRASDAEFQVVNRAAERINRMCGSCATTTAGELRLDVSEIPCLSCLGALRQFQKAFPSVRVRLSFNIRKVSEVCIDHAPGSEDMAALAEASLPPRAHLDPVPSFVPDNRGRPGAAANSAAVNARRSQSVTAPAASERRSGAAAAVAARGGPAAAPSAAQRARSVPRATAPPLPPPLLPSAQRRPATEEAFEHGRRHVAEDVAAAPAPVAAAVARPSVAVRASGAQSFY
eukprot:TRINITY_DN11647_c0_g1_i1.p1 TRINITY_DN11647_c0_g1~~TRINITY_DN11647_c0_g1_i1.p1  ORF type:complete len:846 (-),score=214.14 TRINITY_DN11647_c0_g1_i1:9-2546(-)